MIGYDNTRKTRVNRLFSKRKYKGKKFIIDVLCDNLGYHFFFQFSKYVDRIYVLLSRSIVHTLNKKVWIESNIKGMDRLNKRAWINSIKGHGSTQEALTVHTVYVLF